LLLVAPSCAYAADISGRIDTAHSFSEELFPAANVEVALVHSEKWSVLGHVWTGTDGRYAFRNVPPGNHFVVLRRTPLDSYSAFNFRIEPETTTLTPLFTGEIGLGYIRKSPSEAMTYLFAPKGVVRSIECVEYRKQTGQSIDNIATNQCDRGGDYPFPYAVGAAPQEYTVRATVKYRNGAVALLTRPINTAREWSAPNRAFLVPPCPVNLRLVGYAQEREGFEISAREPLKTEFGGRIERSPRDPKVEISYVPPRKSETMFRDTFSYALRRRGAGEESSAQATVTVVSGLQRGCEASTAIQKK
jgi:hypothetical protein